MTRAAIIKRINEICDRHPNYDRPFIQWHRAPMGSSRSTRLIITQIKDKHYSVDTTLDQVLAKDHLLKVLAEVEKYDGNN